MTTTHEATEIAEPPAEKKARKKRAPKDPGIAPTETKKRPKVSHLDREAKLEQRLVAMRKKRVDGLIKSVRKAHKVVTKTIASFGTKKDGVAWASRDEVASEHYARLVHAMRVLDGEDNGTASILNELFGNKDEGAPQSP